QPPEGKSRDCLLVLALRDGSSTTLCAESEDDAVQGTVRVGGRRQEGHTCPPGTAPQSLFFGAGASPAAAAFGPAAPGGTRVLVREDPYRVSGDQMALGLLAGAAPGAALGSFMWMPCWF
ncbi:Pleckstrin homology domain-containing family B member 2, partial [Tinamus guttatus]